MKALLPLIEQAAVNGLMNKKAPFMRKNKFGLGLAALSGLLFFLALVFATLSGYGWLLVHYAQPMAALIVSGVVFSTSLIFGLTGFFLLKKKKQPPWQEHEITSLISQITDAVGEEFTQPIQDNPKTAVLIASVAGLVAGERLN